MSCMFVARRSWRRGYGIGWFHGPRLPNRASKWISCVRWCKESSKSLNARHHVDDVPAVGICTESAVRTRLRWKYREAGCSRAGCRVDIRKAKQQNPSMSGALIGALAAVCDDTLKSLPYQNPPIGLD